MENGIIDRLEAATKLAAATKCGLTKIPTMDAQALLLMLKEQEDTINELQNAYGYLQKQFFETQDKLLKEVK